MRNQRDGNEPGIVISLLRVGATVRRLDASVGGDMAGLPDLLVGFRKQNYLLEVKRFKGTANGTAIASLSPDQLKFWESWHGSATIVRNATEALRAIGAIGPNQSVELQ